MVTAMIDTEREHAAAAAGLTEVARGVWSLRLLVVNVVFVRSDSGWVLVDAGIAGGAGRIARAAEDPFGAAPDCIVLTHGHFDHIGAARTLAERWDVPVYAHPLEAPYLDGRSPYPPPDPSVGGGLMSLMAPLYPRGPIDLGRRLRMLPKSGTVPGLPEWAWVHTPGHTPGHISLFRQSDRTLISGDAFVTTRQESMLSVLSQRTEMHGPPMYFTPDWRMARDSVRMLAALGPRAAITGHGPAMEGPELRRALDELADHFDELACPRRGRYLHDAAAADESGVTYVPPPGPGRRPGILAAAAAGALILGLAAAYRGRSRGRFADPAGRKAG